MAGPADDAGAAAVSTGEVAGIGGLEGVGSTVVVIKAVDVLVEVPGAAATAILSLTEEIFAGEPTTAALIFPALPDGAAGAVGGVAGVVGAGAEEAAIAGESELTSAAGG